MVFKMDIKSLIVGLLVGLVAIIVMGATHGSPEGAYQLSMAAVSETDVSGAYVVYARMHTGSGKIETLKYMLQTNDAIPHLGNNTRKLLGTTLGD